MGGSTAGCSQAGGSFPVPCRARQLGIFTLQSDGKAWRETYGDDSMYVMLVCVQLKIVGLCLYMYILFGRQHVCISGSICHYTYLTLPSKHPRVFVIHEPKIGGGCLQGEAICMYNGYYTHEP